MTAPPFLTDRNGGATTAEALRGRPFNQSARNLDMAGLGRFASGAVPFDQAFSPKTGLGPDFIEPGCLSCHIDRTSARHPSQGEPPGLLVRVSLPGLAPDGHSLRPVSGYGLQLDTQHVGVGAAEASVSLRWTTHTVRYPDGRRVRLRRPTARITPHRGALPSDVDTSLRMAPTVVGLGLLEAIPTGHLRDEAREQVAAGVVSGRINQVIDPRTGQLVVGRFGWKAGQPSVESQTRAALANDMGITTAEMDPQVLSDLIYYTRTVAVPISRGTGTTAVKEGARLFATVGCAACHATTQRSGSSDITQVAHQTFHPYTDLLLHDMGSGLADGRPDFGASGREWRTAPLWGLGRRVEVTGVEAFLHDGRARTPEEAILWHGGEAASARRKFMDLSAADRRRLLAFLSSL